MQVVVAVVVVAVVVVANRTPDSDAVLTKRMHVGPGVWQIHTDKLPTTSGQDALVLFLVFCLHAFLFVVLGLKRFVLRGKVWEK